MAKAKKKRASPVNVSKLKDELWAYMMSYDLPDYGGDLDISEKLLAKLKAAQAKAPAVTVASFTIPARDAGKVASEVEESCLSEAAKRAILKAIGAK